MMKVDNEPYAVDGVPRYPGKLAQLLWFRADETRAKLERLADTSAPEWAIVYTDQPEAHHPMITEIIQELTLIHHADLSRRVCVETTSFPLKLLNLAKRYDKRDCDERRKLGAELLDTAFPSPR